MKLCERLGMCDFNLRRAVLHIDLPTFMLVVAFSIALIVGYRTFYGDDNPFINESGSATAYRMGDYTTIEYDRSFTITEDFNGRVYRIVDCNGSRTFDIPSQVRVFKRGTHHTSRTFGIPFRYPPGSQCTLKTYIEWRPTFSLNDHVFPIQDVQFTVNATNKE